MVDGHYPRDVDGEREMAAKDNIIERATFGLKSANARLLCGSIADHLSEAKRKTFKRLPPHSSNARTAAASRNRSSLCVLGQ